MSFLISEMNGSTQSFLSTTCLRIVISCAWRWRTGKNDSKIPPVAQFYEYISEFILLEVEIYSISFTSCHKKLKNEPSIPNANWNGPIPSQKHTTEGHIQFLAKPANSNLTSLRSVIRRKWKQRVFQPSLLPLAISFSILRNPIYFLLPSTHIHTKKRRKTSPA